MRLTFLRHAESEFNLDPSSLTLDCSLTATGVAQASALSGHWSLVLVSPMLRTQLTLMLSKITYDEVQLYSGVREQRADPCDFLEGEDPSELESDEHLMERADDFLWQVQHTYAAHHRDILVVTHCEFITSITADSPLNAQFVVLDLPSAASSSSSASSSSAASAAHP